MIRISHINGDEKVVTRGAFESIFKPLGYKPVAEKEIKEEKVEKPIQEKKELTGETEKVEKPIEEPKLFGNKDKRK